MKRLYTSRKGINSFYPKLQGGFLYLVVANNRLRHVLGNRFNSPVFSI